MASSTDSSVFVDAFPTISSHSNAAKIELQITVPRFREADSSPMAGLVRIPELVPHRDSGPMICLIRQWLEKNKLQSLKSQRKSHVAVVAVQLLSHVRLFETPGTAACQAPLSFTLLELAQIHVHSVGDAIQPYHPLSPLLLPSISPSIKVFSSESALRIR